MDNKNIRRNEGGINMEENIKYLNLLKNSVDADFGKGKEIVKALDDAIQIMQKSIEKENKE